MPTPRPEMAVTSPAVDHEPDLLAQLGGEVAHHSRQGGEKAVDPLHAGAGDRVADLADAGRDALERRLDRDVALAVAQPPGELVAGEHRVGDAVHHPVEQVDREADAAHALLGFGRHDCVLGLERDHRALLAQRGDQMLVVLAAERLAGLERLDQLADPVDHRQHAADQARVGGAAAGPDLGQHILGGVAQLLEARQVEEAAIAFDGVDEAEDLVEPGAVGRIGLPGDDLARQRLQHVAGLREEVVDQFVHGSVRNRRAPTLWRADGKEGVYRRGSRRRRRPRFRGAIN